MASKNGTTPTRKLVYPPDGDPDAPYPVPGEKKFESEFGGRKFIESPKLTTIARALCSADVDPELERATRGLHIRYLWKAEGGARHGAPTLGKCVKPSGLVRHFSEADFVIWLAADHMRELNAGTAGANPAATRFQVEACLYHELKHILEEFTAVIVTELISKMQEAVGPGNSMPVTAGGKSVTLPGKAKAQAEPESSS